MVVFNQLEVGYCFKKGGRIYFYTDEKALKSSINIISSTYLRINNYTGVLKIVGAG